MTRMIICVCHRLTTRKVEEAIRSGARSPKQVHAHHDTKINCGKCTETVCGMIRSHEDEQPAQLIAAE